MRTLVAPQTGSERRFTRSSKFLTLQTRTWPTDDDELTNLSRFL
jgi:hypothetical protein